FEREIIAKAAAFGIGKVRLADLQEGIDGSRNAGELREGEGADPATGKRYTTKDALLRERALIAMMKLGQGELEPLIEAHDRARYTEGKGLTKGQMDAVNLVLSTTDRIVGIQGYAGTGKTTALAVIREAAESAGVHVRGFAVTKTAANVL